MILNDKKLKALVRKIQKEAGTSASTKKSNYVDDTLLHKQDESNESNETFHEMKKLPYS